MPVQNEPNPWPLVLLLAAFSKQLNMVLPQVFEKYIWHDTLVSHTQDTATHGLKQGKLAYGVVHLQKTPGANFTVLQGRRPEPGAHN